MSYWQNLNKRYRMILKCLKDPGRKASWTYKKYHPDCDFEGKRVLNLGCGFTVFKAPNVVNLDMFPNDGVNVVWDLSKTPLPFKDNEFDLIIANHILEHIPGWWDCFKELARIVKVGGLIEVWLPGDGGSTQLGYRDHINVINACSFVGVKGTHRNAANAWEAIDRKENGHVCDLKYAKGCDIVLPCWWWLHILPERVVFFMTDHLRNVVEEIGYFFEKCPPKGATK